MYIVSMKNGTTTTEIQNEHHKLFSGNVVKGINTIDSFTFSILPDNPAFGDLKDFTTLISVYNLARRRYEFYGRVLYTSPQMSDKGLLTQEAICESYLGFMCDSQQEYVEEKNWTVRGLLKHILDQHNAQVEEYKRFQIGQLGVTDPNDNIYIGIQRENTWETITKKLIDTLGGEIRFRVEGSVNYLDYVESIGETKETAIALSKNMKSIVKEKNPSSFITRLIPLGAKLGDDSEERLSIVGVNNGKNYIEDAQAVAEYGIHVGYVELDDVTDATNLLNKGREWLENNNKVSIKYSITALDLSLIGLDVDDFDVGNTYPLKNSLLGIDDTGRVNKKNIDVCDETKTSFEIGESFKTLSELQREQMASVGKLNTDVAEIIRNYATNQKLAEEITRTVSYIEQVEGKIKIGVTQEVLNETLGDYAKSSELEITEKSILQTVSESYVTNSGLDKTLESYATTASIETLPGEILASVAATYATQESVEEVSGKLELKIDESALISKINAVANEITITSDNFTLAADGSITANNATLNGAFESVGESSGDTVNIKEGVITLENKYSSALTEEIRIGGLGITFRSIENGQPNGKRFAIEQIGALMLGDESFAGMYGLQADGAIVLQAPYGVGVRSASNARVKYLYFNDNGSVTWSTARPTY